MRRRTAVLGGVLAVATGAGLGWFAVGMLLDLELPIMAAVLVGFFLALSLTLAAFGASAAWQALRRRPLRGGFFFAAFRLLRWIRPPMITLGLPLLILAGLLFFAGRHDLDNFVGVEFAGAYWLSFFATLAIHELGHVVISLLVGARLARVVIGPLDLVATPDGWHCRIARQWMSVVSGAVFRQLSPPLSPARVIAAAAAGPAANFAQLGAALCLCPYALDDLLPFTTPGRLFFLLSLIYSLLFGAASLIPMRSKPGLSYAPSSDGLIIRQSLILLRQGRARSSAA